MKRNKFFFILVVVLVLPLLTLASCLPPTTPTTAAPAPDTAVTELQTNVATLQKQILEKAEAGSVSALETRMAKAEGNINTLQTQGPGNAYTKTETYTKAEVDAAVAAAITALKNDQSWVTANPSNPSNPINPTTPITGQVTFSTNPTSIAQLFTSATGSQSVFYTMRIMNGTNQWQYVKPVITMSVASSYSARTIGSFTISMSSGSCSMTQAFTTTSDGLTPPTYTIPNYLPVVKQISFSPDTMWTTATPSVVIMPVSGCTAAGEFQIGAGQTINVLVNISNFTTSDTTLWNVSHSISSRSI